MGFQSKLNCIDGSYLIREFVRGMMNNIEMHKKQYFGDIMDAIQERLHEAGKQQTVNTYMNHTQYLKFKINDVENSEDESIHERDAEMLSNALYKSDTEHDFDM
eukprot:998786_1